ncbi:LysR family transcriptional regulator [Salinicola peritrichatus]|uniref:LysR family transcriptional regulator n=1 Tax=Salinicola peritrichatus TaxID=1267424 RepID=UPI000DA12095|nr:LysR family transcriptional regulator [Salinicola peritrichatus]
MRGSEFAELQAFLAVAEQGSFVRAAEAMQVSPSALSQTIKGLEGRLGVRLFHRTTRRVGLTQAGERLSRRLKPAIAEVEAAVTDASELGERPRGRLRLHAFRVGYQLYLEPLLAAFADAYPEIELDLTLDDQPVDMIEAGFDGAIRLGELLEQDMVAIPLGAMLRHCVVASPEYVARHGKPRTPSDLHRHRCINWRWPGQMHPYQWEFQRDGGWFRVAVHGPLIVNDLRAMLDAAVNGVGIAFTVEAWAAPLIRQERLVTMLEPWCAPFEGFYFYYPRQRHHLAAMRAFIDFLKQRSTR